MTTLLKALTVLFALGMLIPGGRFVVGAEDAQVVVENTDEAEQYGCTACHVDPDILDDDRQGMFLSEESMAQDVHRKADVACHECHGGDPTSFNETGAHDRAAGFRELSQIDLACDACHHDAWVGVRNKGVHFKVGSGGSSKGGKPMSCSTCHGTNMHDMRSVDDAQSPVFLDNQVETCGGCHQTQRATYDRSTHAHGLREAGLLVTAVCADCHGSHAIHRMADRRSTLHPSNVADTCSKCHLFLADRLRKSVHGQGAGLGNIGEKAAPGGTTKRRPSCVDCHQGHDAPHPGSEAFRLTLPNRCGNCHVEQFGRYAMSLHGELTELGYGTAAKCSDCHGAHDILRAQEPKSRLSSENRLATCKKCHVHAVRNFANFDPHANHKHAHEYPVLHFIHHWIKLPLNLAFGAFLLHSILWFIRSFVHVFQHGRHRVLTTHHVAFVRVHAVHRTVYLILVVCFLGLIVTGLPLKHASQAWAQTLVHLMGGFESIQVWHRSLAVLIGFGGVLNLAWTANRVRALYENGAEWKVLLFGPDSPMPGRRDLQDLIGMTRWFFGMGPKPHFERWTYWEKFDFWACWMAAAVIGTSGLMLWYPNVFCAVLPGGVLNVAKLLHADLAIYIASCVFMIHLFNTHFRPEKFPLDPSVITGLVSEEHMRSARPEYLARIQKAGNLDEVFVEPPSPRTVRLIKLCALSVFFVGMVLLVLVLVASLGK